jgi:nucleoside-diphosphate-sugar epimerase
MNVAIAGGHGKVGLLLGELLAARGDSVRGLIRSAGQARDLEAVGIRPMLCDLEEGDHVGAAIQDCDAVVFAAGAGPGSGAARKRTMDLGGALKLIDAAREEGVRRYLMVSAMGAASPPAEGGDVFGEYLRAKAEADRALEASGLDYTIVRPGRLTDGPPTARITVGTDLGRGEISRADVAATLAVALETDGTIGKTFELLAGDTPIPEALASL